MIGPSTTQQSCSRFRVLSDGEPAWAFDHKGTLYRFDGFCFSRRRRRGSTFSTVPSWQAPRYGWLRPSDCPCGVWILAPTRGLSPTVGAASELAA